MKSKLREYRAKLHELSKARVAYDTYHSGVFSKFDLLSNHEKIKWLGVYNASVMHFMALKDDLVVEDV